MDTVTLDKDTVEALFKEHDHQSDVVVELYKMVFPDWDNITHVEGWPTVNKATGNKLFNLFIDFDKIHHPKVIRGGLWMNNGFSTVEDMGLNDWQVARCEVTYKEAA